MFEIMTANGLSPSAVLAGKVYKKEIIRFGTFRHPNPFLTDDPEFNFTFGPNEAQQMVHNFQIGLIPSVKLLNIHDEEFGKILGVVKDLEVTDHGVTATLDIQDDETILSLEKRDSSGERIGPGVSVGMDMNFPIEKVSMPSRAEGPVLRHVALATIPWISGMRDWETVEACLKASSHQFNFGHEDYTGIPLVPAEGVQGVDKKTLQAAVKILASKLGKSEEEIMAGIGLSLDDDNSTPPAMPPELQSILDTIAASLAPAGGDDDKKKKSNEDDEADVIAQARAIVDASMKPLLEGFQTLTQQLHASNQAVRETQDQILAREAEDATSTLIKAGKVLPADKPTYVKLYKDNKELFGQITASLPVVAPPFNNEGGSGQEPNTMMTMSNDDVKANVDRLAQYITASSAGKQDSISGGKDR